MMFRQLTHLYCTILFLTGLPFWMYAQEGQAEKYDLDELYYLTQNTSQNDSLRLKAFIDLAGALKLGSGVTFMQITANQFLNQAIDLAVKNNKLELFISIVDSKGVTYRNEAKYSEAMTWHQREFKLSDSLQLVNEQIVALNNLGVVHRRIDDYKQGSEYHLKALKLAEENKDTKGIAIATNGLGNIQYLLDNYDDAMRLFRECLRIEQSINHLLGVAINLNNIGNVYKKMGNNDKALEYYMLSLEVNREVGSQKGVAICYNDIGSVYRDKKDYKKALNYCLLGLELNKSMNDLNYLANSQIRVAQLYIDQQEYTNAIKYLQEALEISTRTQSKANVKDAYNLMYQVMKTLDNPRKALEYLELSEQLHDSILSDNTRKSILQMQTLFDRERSENQITLLKKQKEISELSSKRQRYITIAIAIILLGMFAALSVVSYFIYLRTRANRILKQKNQEIEAAQTELKLYAEQMEIAKEEAIRSNRLKSQFLANMSHEIRTPMNSVIGFTDILAMTINDPVQLNYLESIRSSGKNLLTLINDILDLSKIEAGKMVVDKGPTRIKTLCEEIRNIFSLQLREKNLQFHINIENNIPELVYLSEIRLRQILFNLVGNAIKFTQKGEVNMLVFIENLRSEKQFDFQIKISDTGVGISKANQERIFEAFYQEPGLNETGKGTGLGLTITKRLIEAMNGTISLESEEDAGTTFRIVFRDVVGDDYKPISTPLLHKMNEEQKNPVFFLLLTHKETEESLVNQLGNFNMQLHSFYGIFQLSTLIRQINPDCLIIEPEGFDRLALNELLTICKPLSMQIWMIRENTSAPFPELSVPTIEFVYPQMKNDLTDRVKLISTLNIQDPVLTQNSLAKNLLKANPEHVTEIRMLYSNARRTQFINDTAKFADQLIEFASENKSQKLLNFGNQLRNHVSAFDIEKINTSMESFEEQFKNAGF